MAPTVPGDSGVNFNILRKAERRRRPLHRQARCRPLNENTCGMEEYMNTQFKHANSAPRRNFFRLAGASALGLAGLASASRVQAAPPVAEDRPHRPGKKKGRHRPVLQAEVSN
jgi:hypothetical protein